MKVMFDTNIYISSIRNGDHADILQRRGTVKYMGATVLMELWAGAKTREAKRFLGRHLNAYTRSDRIVALTPRHCEIIGRILADIPENYKTLIRKASFINDLRIAFETVSIGAVLYTEDSEHFRIISKRTPSLKLVIVHPSK